jgi:hypothetical protein
VTWTPPEPVGHDPAAMSQRPRLGRDPDGNLRIVWYDSRSTDWRWKILTSTLNEDTGWSPPVQLTHTGNATWPATADGIVVFTGDRRSQRVQRTPTHEIFQTSTTG